jgi:hypothetical protein
MGAYLLALFRSLPTVVKVLVLVPLVTYLVGLTPQGNEAVQAGLFQLPPRGLEDVAAALFSMVLYPREALFTLIFDLLIFLQLAGIFARRWRPRHFVLFLVACHVGGVLLTLGLAPLLGARVSSRVFGLGAPVMGLFLAFALVFGQQLYRVPGLLKPVQGKKIFWGLVVFSGLLFLFGADTQFIQRVGGMAMGFVLLAGLWRPRKAIRLAGETWQKLRWKWRRRRLKVV